MLDRYRTGQVVPACPGKEIEAGTERTAPIRAVPAVPAVPVEISKARATDVLERFATANGIDWQAAHSQMIDGDAQAGAAQLDADTGDGIELAGVAYWLRLLADRARRSPAPARVLEPLPQQVTCEACQHFEPDRINPPAGAGLCRVNAGADSIGPALHPMALRWCSQFASLSPSSPVRDLLEPLPYASG